MRRPASFSPCPPPPSGPAWLTRYCLWMRFPPRWCAAWKAPLPEKAPVPMSETDPSFDKLLDYLNRARGFDFSGYKVQGLQRRIQKRMQMVKVDDFASYVDFLEVHPDEF